MKEDWFNLFNQRLFYTAGTSDKVYIVRIYGVIPEDQACCGGYILQCSWGRRGAIHLQKTEKRIELVHSAFREAKAKIEAKMLKGYTTLSNGKDTGPAVVYPTNALIMDIIMAAENEIEKVRTGDMSSGIAVSVEAAPETPAEEPKERKWKPKTKKRRIKLR